VLGLAVGAEAYAGAELPPIAGAAAQARRFARWLVDEAGADPAHALLCVSPADPSGGGSGERPATLAGITAAIAELRTLLASGSPDDGDTVLFYFSGHGCQVADDGLDPEQVFLPADWDAASVGGIRFDQLAADFARSSGPGDHIWFLDACRNPVDTTASAIVFSRSSGRQRPDQHRLFAAIEGATSPVRGPFSPSLFAALGGAGRAKARLDGAYWVLFDLVAEVVGAQARQQGLEVEYERGNGPGRIRRLAKVAAVRVGVEVAGAAPGGGGSAKPGTLVFRDIEGDEVIERRAGPGSGFVRVPPSDYLVELTWGGRSFAPKGRAAKVALYEAVDLEFDVGAPPVRARRAGGRRVAPVVEAPHARHVALEHRWKGDRIPFDLAVFDLGAAGPGMQVNFKLLDGGVPTRLFWPTRTGGAGRARTGRVTVAEALGPRPVGDAVARATGGPRADGALSVEDLVAGADDPDGMVLSEDGRVLTIVGAAAILDRAPHRDVVEPFPAFDRLGRTRSGLSVLVPWGSRGRVVVDGGEPIALRRFGHLSGTASRAWCEVEPGFHHLELDVPGRAHVSLRVLALPGRATLVVASGTGPKAVCQFALAPGHLQREASLVDRLQDLRFSAFVQERYAAERPLVDAEVGPEARPRLARLRAGDWPDPITVVVAAWDLARRDGAPQAATVVQRAATRLARTVPVGQLSDLATLQDLAHRRPPSARRAPALLLEAALARPDLPGLPAGAALDYRGPWTAWRSWAGRAPA